MSGAIWLIVEAQSDIEIVRVLLQHHYPQVRLKPLQPPGGVSRLAKALKQLIAQAMSNRQVDDCIAVLHDADLQTRPHGREDYETIKRLCHEHSANVVRIEARDEIEAWLLADEGLCHWLGIKPQNRDEMKQPSGELNSLMQKNKKIKYQGRYRAEVLRQLDGTGHKYSPSMRSALHHLENAPCVQS